jgi:hypothetical protein
VLTSFPRSAKLPASTVTSRVDTIFSFAHSVAQQLSKRGQQVLHEDVELVRQAVQQRLQAERRAELQRGEVERQAEEYEAEGLRLDMCGCEPQGEAHCRVNEFR